MSLCSAVTAGYAGCYEHKWGYADSPHHASYYKGDGTKFAVGPFYAIDGKLATTVQRANLPLRFFTNEGVRPTTHSEDCSQTVSKLR